MKKYYIYATAMLTLAVILGAFGAHAWKDLLGERVDTFQLANDYHIWTSLAVLILAGLFNRFPGTSSYPLAFFVTGACCFYGSLYLLSFPEIFPGVWRSVLGPITPIGGLLMIIGLSWSTFICIKRIE